MLQLYRCMSIRAGTENWFTDCPSCGPVCRSDLLSTSPSLLLIQDLTPCGQRTCLTNHIHTSRSLKREWTPCSANAQLLTSAAAAALTSPYSVKPGLESRTVPQPTSNTPHRSTIAKVLRLLQTLASHSWWKRCSLFNSSGVKRHSSCHLCAFIWVVTCWARWKTEKPLNCLDFVLFEHTETSQREI